MHSPQPDIGFVGISSAQFVANWGPRWEPDEDISFVSSLGLFFPAVTGIMAGANMSGEIKRPAHSIPYGTIYAVIVSGLTYWLLGVLLASSCQVRTWGDSSAWVAGRSHAAWEPVEHSPCLHPAVRHLQRSTAPHLPARQHQRTLQPPVVHLWDQHSCPFAFFHIILLHLSIAQSTRVHVLVRGLRPGQLVGWELQSDHQPQPGRDGRHRPRDRGPGLALELLHHGRWESSRA